MFSGVSDAILTYFIDIHRTELKIISRIREIQLELYCELWSSLYDLKLSSDNLWETLDKKDLEKFGKQLEITDLKFNKSILLVEEDNARDLKEIMNVFWDFFRGKNALYKMRELLRNPELYAKVTEEMIEEAVENNRQIKQRYDGLILQIVKSMREQLKKV